MALIGSVVNQGSLQGEIASYNGALSGVFANTELVGGQVVGMRGLQGEKGDTGDTGATGNGIASVTFVSSSGLVDTYKITFTNGTETTFDVTNGQDGIDGIDGVDGHSPVVTASKVGKVTTVSVDGSAIATINDGNDGQDGSDGQDGADGYSPSAAVSKVGTTATITITDKDGTTTASISGGDANVQSDWNEADTTADDYIKNKPTIPTVNNATLTIQKNGTDINTFTANASSDVTANITVHDVPSGGTSGQVLTKDSNDDYDLSWTTPSGGSSYTATSPISIDGNNDISHETSGVTAGTYDGGDVKYTGFYVPSITVDANGHITSATDLGNLIPLTSSANASLEKGHLIYGYDWQKVVRIPSGSPSSYRLLAGNTSASFALYDAASFYGNSTYLQIMGVTAVDANGNAVIVDWSVDYAGGTGGKSAYITLTVSIAEAYSAVIYIKPIIAYASAGM